MIRSLQNSDVDRLALIWLEAMAAANPQIARAHWQAQLPQARHQLENGGCRWVYVAPGRDCADGFAAVQDDGSLNMLFVAPGAQGFGVGSELMLEAKRGRPQLQLRVFEDNLRARYFLQKHGFVETERQLCLDTGQTQLLMRYRADAQAAAA